MQEKLWWLVLVKEVVDPTRLQKNVHSGTKAKPVSRPPQRMEGCNNPLVSNTMPIYTNNILINCN